MPMDFCCVLPTSHSFLIVHDMLRTRESSHPPRDKKDQAAANFQIAVVVVATTFCGCSMGGKFARGEFQ